MKRRYPILVGELIRRTIDESGRRDDFDRQKACYVWADIVGPVINRLTTRRWIEHDTLHVVIASASLKTELAFMADSIVRQINQNVGSPVISRLKIH